MSLKRTTYNQGGIQTAGNVCYDNEYFGSEFFVSGSSLLTAGFIYNIADAWINWDDEYIENVTWTDCDCDLVCE